MTVLTTATALPAMAAVARPTALTVAERRVASTASKVAEPPVAGGKSTPPRGRRRPPGARRSMI